VVLKVGGIAPFEAQGGEKTKGAIGWQNNTTRAKTLSH